MPKNDYLSSREDIMKLPVPVKVGSYLPPSHQELILHTEDLITNKGLAIISSEFRIANFGELVHVTYHIEDPGLEASFVISWVNTYNRMNSFNCSTGIKLNEGGYFIYNSNNTKVGKDSTSIINRISEVFNFSPSTIAEYNSVTSTLNSTKINATSVSELLGVMFIKENLLTITQFSKIKKVLEDKSFLDGSWTISITDLLDITSGCCNDGRLVDWIQYQKAITDFLAKPHYDLLKFSNMSSGGLTYDSTITYTIPVQDPNQTTLPWVTTRTVDTTVSDYSHTNSTEEVLESLTKEAQAMGLYTGSDHDVEVNSVQEDFKVEEIHTPVVENTQENLSTEEVQNSSVDIPDFEY